MTILEHVSLKELTTMKIGGTARYFVSAKDTGGLKEAVAFAREKKLPFIALGGGSNVLIAGKEFSGLVIKNDIQGIEWHDEGETMLVIAGAGEVWDTLVGESVSRNLWGIENLSGIPGTVGAAPIQNIGAYGSEVKDTIEWVEAYDPSSDEISRLSNDECRFAYRDSIFKHAEGKQRVVCRVAFRLRKQGRVNIEYKDLKKHFEGKSFPSLAEIRRAVLLIRSGKFPDLREYGTAGSFFKNPIVSKEEFDELKKRFPDLPGFPLDAERSTLNAVKVPLAWILDNVCGLKGFEKGNVKLFEKQPIVLVQNGSASAEEVASFAQEVIERVKERTGIDVEWEVQHIKNG